MKYLIFVDFDGVLTSNRIQIAMHDPEYTMWSKFDSNVMEFFNRIHYTYDDVSFVWTTTWRNGFHKIDDPTFEHILYSMWYNAGFKGKFGLPFMVNPDGQLPKNDRASEILDYLQTYGKNHKDFLIFDDSDYGFNRVLPVRRFVKTDPDNGMLFKHMKDALAIMGNWKKRS